jgi:diguanylate cyclase (GGDEF)-like protein
MGFAIRLIAGNPLVSFYEVCILSLMPSKNRLTWLICLLLLVGFLATTLVSYTVSVTQLKKGFAESILPLTSDTVYSEIQKDLIRPIFIASMMASDTFLRDWALFGEKDIKQISKYLEQIKTKYQTVTSFFVSEQSGNYYHAGGLLKQVHADEPRDEWYFRVRSMEKPYELNVDRDLANGDALTFFINHRVLDYQGNYLGATGCGLSVTTIAQLLRAYEIRYQRHIFFVDPQGFVTFRAESEKDWKAIGEVDGLRDIATTILSKESGSFSYKRDKQTYLLHSRFLPELGWYLLVEQSLDQEMRLLRKTLLINLSLCLVISLVILVVVYRTISHYQQRLERMATIDKLTNLNNRYSGETLFDQAIREASRQHSELSVILLDIDRFKNINDQYSHQAGDAVLADSARIIRVCLREADSICRWGGEEFLVILKDCALENAFSLAEKIREHRAEKIVSFQKSSLVVFFSLGVAQWQPGESKENFLMRADNAMYRAKSNGRNRTEKSGNVGPIAALEAS